MTGTAPVGAPSSPYRAPAFRQQNSPTKGQWRNAAVIQNKTSEPVLSVHNSEPVLTILGGREPVLSVHKSNTEPVLGNMTDTIHSLTNNTTEPVHNVHKSSTEPVLRHIPSEETLTNKIQSEPALKTYKTDNDSELPRENTIDYFDDDFRTINVTCEGDDKPKSVNIKPTYNDTDEICDNENKEILAENDSETEKGKNIFHYPVHNE